MLTKPKPTLCMRLTSDRNELGKRIVLEVEKLTRKPIEIKPSPNYCAYWSELDEKVRLAKGALEPFTFASQCSLKRAGHAMKLGYLIKAYEAMKDASHELASLED